MMKKTSKTTKSAYIPPVRDSNDHHAATNKVIMNSCEKFRKGASMAGNRLFFWYNHNKKKGLDYTEFFPQVLADQMNCSRKTVIRWLEELVKQELFTLERVNPHHRIVKYRMRPTEKFLALKGSGTKGEKSEKKQNSKQNIPSQNGLLKEEVFNINLNKSTEPSVEIEKKEKEKTTIIYPVHPPQQMVDIWNKEIDPTIKVTLTKRIARFLNAALKWKFGGSVHKWLEYCKTIATSDYLMGKFKNGFRIIIDTALRFNFIDKIFQYAFGVKPVSVPESKEILEVSLREEIKTLEEPEKAKEIRLDLLKKYGAHTYKSWFRKLEFFEKEGALYRKERTRFEEDWFKNHYPELRKVTILLLKLL